MRATRQGVYALEATAIVVVVVLLAAILGRRHARPGADAVLDTVEAQRDVVGGGRGRELPPRQ